MEEVRKRGNEIKTGDKECNLSELDNKTNEELEDAKYNDLEDMVFRMELTYSEIGEILEIKYVAATPIGYTYHLENLKKVMLN